MIIGITGPAGSGKDTSAQYIVDHFNISHVSGGDILREMLSSIGLEPKKPAVVAFGAFIRHQYGGGEVARRAIEKGGEHQNVMYSGFRSPAEAEAVLSRSGKIIYIDAPTEVRYDRIAERARDGDPVTDESLKAQDQREFLTGAAENENLPAVKAMASIVIVNDGTLEDLYQKLSDYCQSILI
ncbi:MAG: hypothetical protein JWM52_199 [Candidatus Saccharibacteria bacterium]|nr:hypothetical protein [Candidatus Saccharibacteria bacterium]